MINVTYDTKEKVRISDTTFHYARASISVEPLRIVRSACGMGAASKRFKYTVVFTAPKDAKFAWKGELRENINRKENKNFNPKDYCFVNNVAKLTVD